MSRNVFTEKPIKSKPELLLVWSRVCQCWLSTFGDGINTIGPDRRSRFASVQDFNDYCAATGTELRALAMGGPVAAIVSHSGK